MTEKKTAAVVLAAGKGRRMQSGVPKQYMSVGDKPLIYYALRAFEESVIEQITLVTAPGEEEFCRREIVKPYGFKKVRQIVAGGEERFHSVYRGLCALRNCDYVLIHDGARPFVTPQMIARALSGAQQYGSCVVGMPVKDTIKVSDFDGYACQTPKRELVWAVQTPQAFSYKLIKTAYEKLFSKKDVAVTDDAMVVETMLNRQVKLIPGSYYNIKVTTKEDLAVAEVFLKEYQKEEWKKKKSKKILKILKK